MFHSFLTCLNTPERIRTQDIYVLRGVHSQLLAEHSCGFVLGWGRAVRAKVACSKS